MKTSLRSVFAKVRDFLVGEIPPNAVDDFEYDTICDMMKERGCNLEIAYVPVWHLRYMENIGIVKDEKTSVYEIMHAESHLADVYKNVTGRTLEKIKQYSPEERPQNYYIPMMF